VSGYIFGAVSVFGLLFAFYVYEKNNLIQDIKELVKDCREQESFDDRSEDKLMSWLDGTENDLQRKNLWRLKQIKKEMWHYLEIHVQMELEDNDT
jgi:hypothetical protein